MKTLLLSKEDVAGLISTKEVIGTVEEAYKAFNSGHPSRHPPGTGAAKPHIRHTPLLRAEKMETPLGCEVYLKPETLQITGAFKIRGALNKALSLPREAIANGIISTSSGNHAQGLAYAARMLGVKALLVVPIAYLPSAGRSNNTGCSDSHLP